MESVRFFFGNEDGMGTNVEIFALVEFPKDFLERENMIEKIRDRIHKYCKYVEGWQYVELVEDVLKSLHLRYSLNGDPVTFYI